MANPLKIINEIQAPDLTQENLSASLNEVFEKINDNFKKIVSAPIYRGQKGESVKIKPVELMTPNNHAFTDEGRKIVEAIFDDVDLTSWDGTTNRLGVLLPVKYRTIRNVNVYDYFSKNPSILMFQLDDVKGTNLSPAQLYMFQDLRVSVVNDTDADGEGGFKDASCFVSFEWDNDGKTYKYIKASEFPTICWSKGVGDFVWSINGQVTNIIAKGLKGLDASFTLPLFMVQGVEGNERAWNVTYVYDMSASGWKSVGDIVDMGIYTPGMGCVAYMYSGEGVDKTITGLEITTINNVEADAKIIYLAKMDCSIEAKPLNVMMDEIRPWSDGMVSDTNPPALYIPASAGEGEKFVHAMWRDRGTVADADEVKHLHIGYVKLDGNGIDKNAPDVDLYLHNYDNIIFPSKLVSMQLAQESIVLNAGSSFSMNRGETLITTPKLTMDVPKFYIKNNDTAYISATPTLLQLNSASIQIPHTSSFTIKGEGPNIRFGVGANLISLGTKTIEINKDLLTDNIINIGGGYSTVNIRGKNFEINSGGVDFKTSPTTFGGEATFGGPVIIRERDYSEIISFDSYKTGLWADKCSVFYRLKSDEGLSCRIGKVNLIGWGLDGTPMSWYNVGNPIYDQGNGPGWRNFAGRCIRIGHMVKLYGLYKPFGDHTDSLLFLNHIPGFSASYIRPDLKNNMGGNYVIGICQTNDANGEKSAPEVWRDAKSSYPAGAYPVDDPGGKKHGWVYLFTNEDAIMFVTPDASKTYYFEVTYFI